MTPDGWRVTGGAEDGYYCCQTAPTLDVKIERQQSMNLGVRNLPCQSWDLSWSEDPAACRPLDPLGNLFLPHEGHGGSDALP